MNHRAYTYRSKAYARKVKSNLKIAYQGKLWTYAIRRSRGMPSRWVVVIHTGFQPPFLYGN